MTPSRTALVIGGGLVGLWSARFLQRDGWQVTVVDRGRIGSGASFGNCGYVCPSHVLPLSGPGAIAHTLPGLFRRDAALSIPLRFDPGLWKWLWQFSRQCTRTRQLHAATARHALLESSMALYRDFAATAAAECEWQSQGLLLVYQSAADFERFEASAELLRSRYGLRVEPHVGEAARALEPTLRENLAGGWYFPDDAHVRPDRLLASLRDAVVREGGDVLEHAEVLSLRIVGGRAEGVETNVGSMATDLVILATGAEAPRFARPLGCSIPIQPGKGYSLTMPPLRHQPRIPMIFEEHHVAITPFDGALRVGSTMQFTGYDRTLEPRRLDLLRRSAEAHLSEPLPPQAEAWAGWRPMVFDGLPCIDRAPAAENVIVAAGNDMIGLASAPATGKLVAELASGAAPHVDPAPYRLARFATAART